MLQTIVELGLATSTVSVTVAQSRLFQPLRAWVSGVWPWMGELLSCPYCLGHWVAAILLLLTTAGHVTPIGGLILWLSVTAVSSLVSGIIGKLFGE